MIPFDTSNEYQITFKMADIVRYISELYIRKVTAAGMKGNKWHILLALHKSDGLKQTELATFLQVQPITLSRMITALIKDGLIERRDDAEDKRVKRLWLTEKAEPYLIKIRDIRHEIREIAYKGLSQEERQVLLGFLNRTTDNLETHLDAERIKQDGRRRPQKKTK